MNEIERDLRDMLERKAGSVGGVAPRLPETVRKHGRRRQTGTAAIGFFTVAAVALVSFAGLRSIDLLGDADGGVPADDPWAGYEVFERTATIENFTITSPSDWYLVNQWPLGALVATSGQSGTCEATVVEGPREIVGQPSTPICETSSPVPVPDAPPVPMVLLSNTDLGLGTSPCLMEGVDLRGNDAVLEIAIDTAAVYAQNPPQLDHHEWPVAFAERVEEGPCGRGHYVRFSDGHRPYLAWAGFGPEATDDDRRTLFGSFAEMDVVKWDPQSPYAFGPAYVIAGGENAAGPWRLELRASVGEGFDANVDLHLIGSEGKGPGVANFTVPDATPIEQAGGDPTFGAVTKEATGVELILEEGTPPIPATLVPLPPSFAFPLDLFFASNPSDVPAKAVALGVKSGESDPPETVPPIPPDVDHLLVDQRWAPPITREGGLIVMPVTFPDGSTAELVYPPDLGLEQLNVYPATYGSIPGESGPCGWPVNATRHDPRESWVSGTTPLATYMRDDGEIVSLWKGRKWNEPYNYLIYRFGSWNVLLGCQSLEEINESMAVWANNLLGRESREGLLVLEGSPPLEVPAARLEGSTIRFSGDDVVVDLSRSRSDCSGRSPELGANDGVIQWCIHPAGDIYVYATAHSPAQNAFLERLVQGLEIRNYRAAK